MARNELITLLGELDEKQIAQLQNQAEEFLHINTELIQSLTPAHAAKVRLPDLSRKVFHAESSGISARNAASDLPMMLEKSHRVLTKLRLRGQRSLPIPFP